MSDLYNSDLHEPTAEADADGLLVYCVMCIDDDDGSCCVHIFSTQEKAQAFAATDERPHVFYDYTIDHPERMEQAVRQQ